MDSPRADDLQDLASQLGFELSDEGTDALLETVEGLRTEVAALSDDEYSHLDAQAEVSSSDKYNALLARYDDPRQDTTNGPLADLTLTVKDTIAVKDLQMTAGAAEFSIVPGFDAVVVERLLDAGAHIDGKANLEAYAFGITGENSDYGTVQNPRMTEFVSGGSSSGSAAAVAGGIVDAALGTDAGGSLRIPAACCGLVGAKPTHGLVPRHGLLDFAPSMDTIGPLAPDVETAARVLDAIAGHDLRDPSSSRVKTSSFTTALEEDQPTTIGVPTSLIEATDNEIAMEFRSLTNTIADQTSVTIRDVNLPLGEIATAYFIVSASEFACVIRQADAIRGQGTGYMNALRAGLHDAKERGISSSHMIWRVLPVAYVDALTDGKAYMAARRETIALQEQLETIFGDVNLLLAPTLRRCPPGYGEIETREDVLDMLGNTSIFNLTGNPAVGVSAGPIESTPFGVQVIAPHFEDGLALAGAQLVERLSK